MSRAKAYWDTSALLPLCILQPQTTAAQACFARYEIVTWWATPIEIVSGLNRLERMGTITHSHYLATKPFVQKIVRDFMLVHESAGISKDACALLGLHPLRAADALQLAAALEACEHQPRGYVFITADRRLADAAKKTGFTVECL